MSRIIGVNGKIGSGKDTVGRIIQYLTSEYRDKYSFVEWRDRVENYNSNTYSPWEIKKFAGKLKTMASLLTGISVEKFEDQEFKKTYLGEEWGSIRKNPLQSIPVFKDVQFNEMMTVREFLQILGTEAMRDNLHENVWVNALFADYKPVPNKTINESFKEQVLTGSSKIHYTDPYWVITDMRFENELESVVLRNGITIRVVRPGTSVGTHPSETALDDTEFHYEIINDRTMEYLIDKVEEILMTENLI